MTTDTKTQHIYSPTDSRAVNPVLPLCLLAADRRCLVVGGGQVATRKVETLIRAGAKVTVVSPHAEPSISALAKKGELKWLARHFTAGDCHGAFVVYAATNDETVNRDVLNACRAANVLCGIVDRGWEQGDFISPAVINDNGITIAVSTGGKSCRRSRLVKESLSRHLDLADKSDLLLIEIDHTSLSLADREQLFLSEEQKKRTGDMLKHLAGLHEFILLCTCNRFALIAFAADSHPLICAIEHMLGLPNIKTAEAHVLKGIDAFYHTAEIAAGLHSQTPCEKNIVAQIKNALNQAQTNSWAGAVMRDCVGRTLALAKNIRRTAEKAVNPMDIQHVCIEFIQQHRASLKDQKVLVAGAGTVAISLLELLIEVGADATCCCRKSRLELAAKLTRKTLEKINIKPLSDLGHLISNYPIIICATSSSTPLINAKMANALPDIGERLLIDLGVPRNIAPDSISSNGRLTIIDLDGLKGRRYYEARLKLEHLRPEIEKVKNKHRTDYDKITEQFKGGHQIQPPVTVAGE